MCCSILWHRSEMRAVRNIFRTRTYRHRRERGRSRGGEVSCCWQRHQRAHHRPRAHLHTQLPQLGGDAASAALRQQHDDVERQNGEQVEGKPGAQVVLPDGAGVGHEVAVALERERHALQDHVREHHKVQQVVDGEDGPRDGVGGRELVERVKQPVLAEGELQGHHHRVVHAGGEHEQVPQEAEPGQRPAPLGGQLGGLPGAQHARGHAGQRGQQLRGRLAAERGALGPGRGRGAAGARRGGGARACSRRR
jgi:hypothetical protein